MVVWQFLKLESTRRIYHPFRVNGRTYSRAERNMSSVQPPPDMTLPRAEAPDEDATGFKEQLRDDKR